MKTKVIFSVLLTVVALFVVAGCVGGAEKKEKDLKDDQIKKVEVTNDAHMVSMQFLAGPGVVETIDENENDLKRRWVDTPVNFDGDKPSAGDDDDEYWDDDDDYYTDDDYCMSLGEECDFDSDCCGELICDTDYYVCMYDTSFNETE